MVRTCILAIGVLLAAAGVAHAQATGSGSTSANSTANVEFNPISGNPVAPATPLNNSSSSSAASTLMNFGAVGASTTPCAVSTGCDPLSVPAQTQGEPGSTLMGGSSIGAGPSNSSGASASVNPQVPVQLPGEAPNASTGQTAKTAPAAPAPSVPSPSCTAQIPTASGMAETGNIFGGAASGGC